MHMHPLKAQLLRRAGVVLRPPPQTRLDERSYWRDTSDASIYKLRHTDCVLKIIVPTCVLRCADDEGTLVDREIRDCGDDDDDCDGGAAARCVHAKCMAVTAGEVRMSNALNEVLVHALVSRMSHLTPHVLASECYYVVESGKGYIFMERYPCTLGMFDPPTAWWTVPNACALLFQVLHALHVAGQGLQLKHHDLHYNNVGIQSMHASTTFNGQRLSQCTHLKYTVGEEEFYLPNTGYLPKLADFGMASVTLGAERRAYRGDLRLFSEDRLGKFDEVFHGQRGYDMQTFLSGHVCPKMHAACTRWAALHRLYTQLCEVVHMGKLRNLRPKVASDVTPGEALRSRVFAMFRCVPVGEGVRVADCGGSPAALDAFAAEVKELTVL